MASFSCNHCAMLGSLKNWLQLIIEGDLIFIFIAIPGRLSAVVTLWWVNDLSSLLSVLSLSTHVVIPIPSTLQWTRAMFLLTIIALLNLPLNHESHHVHVNPASRWHGRTIGVPLKPAYCPVWYFTFCFHASLEFGVPSIVFSRLQHRISQRAFVKSTHKTLVWPFGDTKKHMKTIKLYDFL